MKIYNFLIPLLIFAFGLVNCGRDLFGWGFEHYPGDLADTRFNNVILEHDYQWLIGNQESLWDPPFFYPAQNMLAGSDNHLGTFLLYVPFRLVGLNETNSFQAWVLCLFVLNFFVFYKVARKFGLNVAASSAGAFLFTFSMPVLGSVFHIQTLCKFSFPLVFLFFYRILFVQQKQNLVYFSLSLVHVFYCSLYFGVFTLLLLGIFFIAALFRKHQLKNIFSRKQLPWLIGAAVIFIGCMVPLYLPYAEQEKFSPYYTLDQLMPIIPHPYSYMMPHGGSIFYSFLFNAAIKHTSIFWMHIFFIGFTSMGLIIAAIYYLRKEKKQPVHPHRLFFVLCGITLLAGILLTSAAGKFTLYKLLLKIDAFNHLKVLGRIVLLELFFMAMLVAYALHRMKFSITMQKTILVTLVILVCTEHWIKPGSLKIESIEVVQHHHEYINKAIDAAGDRYHAFVVLKNANREPFESVIQIDAMMAALQKNMPTLNGYTTIADPVFYQVHHGNRHGVQVWLHHCQLDTLRTDSTILFIP